ncbi:MAG: Fic family protein [Comamonadaceae bacterium]|nr:MAG: Fic family protein [Comamonadaceae bacterium]
MSQKFALYDAPHQMEPLLPGEHRLAPLLEQAHDLQSAAHRLSGMCQPGALQDLRRLLRAMNSYYTNKIEGQQTLPLDIERALRNDYSADAERARRQRLAVAHMVTEAWLEDHWREVALEDAWSETMVCAIHAHLFSQLPEADRSLPEGDVLQPGALRDREVSVGIHAAPSHQVIDAMLQRWGSFYAGVRRGELQVLAAAASHQRLAWIHPFRDGNGRVARLHTHLLLGRLGLTNGLWSPLRGFARTHETYYAQLAAADAHRAGDLDGRGNLSERGLIDWIAYVLGVCADQVSFMAGLLDLAGMKERIAACLAYEEKVVKQGVRSESLRALHYLFATQAELERADFKAMLGLGERQASAQVSALLKRELVKSDSPYGKLRFGVPLHALRFYFPNLWPEAEAS